MAQLGKTCERDLYYQFTNAPRAQFTDLTLAKFEMGHVIEAHLNEILEAAGYDIQPLDPATGKQWQVSDFDGKLLGYLDGKVQVGGKAWDPKEHVYDIKSCNKRRFEELLKVGYQAWSETYYAQAILYMGYTGINRFLAVVYNKDSSEIYTERLRFDSGFFETLKLKAARVIGAGELGAVPDRPEKGTSKGCKLCKWCDFNAYCWDEPL
jgi:hypothetical protein